MHPRPRRCILLLGLLPAVGFPREALGQVRVIERAQYQGFDGNIVTAQDPYVSRTAYYEPARASVVSCTPATFTTPHEAREWYGPGEISMGTAIPWTPYTTCAFPGRPGLGFGVDKAVFMGTSLVYEAGAWRQATTAIPSRVPYSPFAIGLFMALDERRQRVVLMIMTRDFPSHSPVFTATWEFDGQAWVEASTTAAWDTPLGHHPNYLVYHDSHQRIETVNVDGAIKSWDGSAWTLRVAPIPGFVVSGAGYDPHRDRLVTLGHRNGSGLVLEYDSAYTVISIFAGAGYPNVISNAVYDQSRRRIVCTTQATATSPLQTSSYDGPNGIIATWSDLSGSTLRPSARSDAMLATDVTRGAILFGGRNQNGSPNNETWLWDGSTWTDLALPSAPSARSAAAMSSGGNTVVLFGGMSATNQTLGDTWVCDTAGWRKLTTFSGAVPARRSHAMATQHNVVPPTVYMFGGTDGQVAFDDLRRLDYVPNLGGYWQWSLLPSALRPQARSGHSIVVDEARNKIVLFGGADEWISPLGDTWEWDLTSGGWTQRVPTHSPPARWDHGMVYDRKRGRTVLIGGYGGTYLDDLWEWDGTDWTKRVPETGAIAPTENMGITFDPRTNRIVMFGGNANATVSDRTHEIVEWNGPGALRQLAPLTLTVHGAPTVKGSYTTPLDVAFPCSGNMGVLFLGLAPTPTPSYQGTQPYFCSAQELYTPIAINLPANGNPARFTLPVPTTLEGALLSVQGLALTNANCLDVTAARNILVRSVR